MAEWNHVELNAENGTVRALRLSAPGNLRAYDMSRPIPPELGNLHYLEELSLIGGFAGKATDWVGQNIPPELCNLNSPKVMVIQDNLDLLSGIPPELGKLRDLEILILSGNRLSGGIPRELSYLTNLKVLDLRINQVGMWREGTITWGIPPEIGNLRNLRYIRTSHNHLVGIVPRELGNPMELEYLNMQENWLVGGIPAEVDETISANDGRWVYDPMRRYKPTESAGEICDESPGCIDMSDLSYEQVSLLVMMDLGGSADVNWGLGTARACVTQETMKEYPSNPTLKELKEKGSDGVLARLPFDFGIFQAAPIMPEE